MNIFFCDDNKKLINGYAKLARDYIEEKFNKIGISVYSLESGRDLLILANELEVLGNIYFLDIDLNSEGINGIELATEIRLFDPYAKISFISTHEELLVETIRQKINILNFIFKDDGLESVEREIKESIHSAFMQIEFELGNIENDRMFKINDGVIKKEIPIKNIFYFVTMKHGSGKILLTSKNEELDFFSSMKKIEEQIPQFIRCHKSFLINPDNVKRIDETKKRIFFDNEENIFCDYSMRKERQVKKLFG